MKFILTIFFNFVLVAFANAGATNDKIKIGSNAKTAELEIRYNSKSKKNISANVIITDSEGKQVSAFTCEIKKGTNTVCLHNALQLKEGIYSVKMTVNNKISSTNIVFFN